MNNTTRRDFLFVHGVNNAEDFAVVPGTPWVIASGVRRDLRNPPPLQVAKGAVHEDRVVPGGLHVLDRRSKSFRRVWPDLGQPSRRDPRWDNGVEMLSAEHFSCSGLHLMPGQNGIHTLYAVHNHSRQSIEVFEVSEQSDGLSFIWTGALLLPPPCGANSVAVLADGTVVATAFTMSDDPDSLGKMQRGENTGHVLLWSTADGWRKIPGTEASGPNGVVASADGSTIYVPCTGAQRLMVKSLARDGEPARFIELGFTPDNVRWGDDGRLWIAGFPAMTDATPRACSIDPATMVPVQATLPQMGKFGNCSVALRLDDELWMGCFTGDCIAIIPLD